MGRVRVQSVEHEAPVCQTSVCRVGVASWPLSKPWESPEPPVSLWRGAGSHAVTGLVSECGLATLPWASPPFWAERGSLGSFSPALGVSIPSAQTQPCLDRDPERSQRGAFRDVCARGLLSWTSCNFTSQNVTPATPGIGVRGLPACEEPPSWQGSNKRVLGSSRAGKWHLRAGGVGECCHGDPFMPH